MATKDLPNPGSDEAIDDGCICPVLDNEHGSYERTGGRFITVLTCPLHGRNTEDE